MGVKKMFMYSQVLNEMNDDISFFDMSKTFMSNTQMIFFNLLTPKMVTRSTC